MIAGDNPPGHNLPGSEPPVSGKAGAAGRNPQGITPVELEHNVRCCFLLQGVLNQRVMSGGVMSLFIGTIGSKKTKT